MKGHCLTIKTGIFNPVLVSDKEYKYSITATEPLVRLILTQELTFDHTDPSTSVDHALSCMKEGFSGGANSGIQRISKE